MAGIVLSVEKRERTGTGGARATRNADLIPGVLYGGARGAIPIELKSAEVMKALRSGKFISHLVEINHRGERQPVIPRAIQYHPVNERPIHIDLYRVEENSMIAVDVVVHFKNHEASPGIKRGGALNIVAHTINLRVPANNIPEEIVVDLTGLDIGDVVHIKDIKLPGGVQTSAKARNLNTIATIVGRTVEAEEKPAAAATDAPAEGETPAAEGGGAAQE
jgi:large subunit ribosomal protein L25